MKSRKHCLRITTTGDQGRYQYQKVQLATPVSPDIAGAD